MLPEGLESNYVEWRWIGPDDCAVQEQCVTGTGWRRLLRFDASVHNQGEEALHIGAVGEDYNPFTEHNIFVYSECHEHYHFGYYGDFRYGDDEGDKKAFCLISTSRRSNNAASPMTTDYDGCGYQGISAGWGDDYSAYLDCQWIDITDLDTSGGAVTAPLRFTFNPDRFICEGERILDESGQTVFSPSEYTTEEGEVVDRPECDFAEGWDLDNEAALDLEIPAVGSAVTEPCPIRMFGGERNCGYAAVTDLSCDPGSPVTLSCAAEGAAHLRLCEGSTVHGSIACTHRERLAAQDVEGTAEISVTCPSGRGEGEAGGVISVLAGAVDADAAASVQCELVP